MTDVCAKACRSGIEFSLPPHYCPAKTSGWRLNPFPYWELHRRASRTDLNSHLRIKAFYGRSQNAVKAQIWIAISVYVLVAIVKKRLALKPDLYTILQILSVHIFGRTELRQALLGSGRTSGELPISNQLQLFNF